MATQKPKTRAQRRARRAVQQPAPRTRPNPLFGLMSGELVTLDQLEAAAEYEVESDTFLSGEQQDLIAIIPHLCALLRAALSTRQTRASSDSGGEHG